jgi:CubicO group peptidase (beta-lactamase class C family)
MKKVFGSIFFLVFTITVFAQKTPFDKKFPLVDKFFDSVMKEWNIPGLALAIVYKDKLIYGKGYGFRDLEKKLPVTSATLFPIASNTKLFTATAVCMLAEQGKLSLDKPVRTYMPSLHFYNEELDARVTLRDMLSHRTGLSRNDGIWLNAPFSRKEAVSKVQYMKPQLGFREGYIYNNMMFVACGNVLEEMMNMKWEDIIRKQIFEPLQMKTSCFTYAETSGTGNYSFSYFEADTLGTLKPRRFEGQSEALGPAGTIRSSIEDMSHWMIAQLNKGKWNNQQAVSSKAIEMTLEPNTISDKEGKWPELSNSLYCLGRSIQTYKGYKITSHTGSIDGFYSNLTFIPSEELGIFVVLNAVEAGSLRSVISLPVIDRLLALTSTPWTQRYRKDYLEDKAAARNRAKAIENTKLSGTTPSHPLASYAGKYTNPVYGDIEIKNENEGLLFQFRSIRSPLHHFHYDQFVTREDRTDTPSFRLSFLTGMRGNIDRIGTSVFGDPVIEFVRVPGN